MRILPPVLLTCTAALIAGCTLTAPAPNTNGPITQFRAGGNEPFWSATVRGSTLTYSTPETPDTTIPVERFAYAKGVEYSGTLNGQPLTLNIRTGSCEDGMTTHSYPMTAKLFLGSAVLKGCAQPDL